MRCTRRWPYFDNLMRSVTDALCDALCEGLPSLRTAGIVTMRIKTGLQTASIACVFIYKDYVNLICNNTTRVDIDCF